MSIDPSILSSLGLKPDNYFEGITRGAKRLAAAEKKGGPIPDDLDFSVQEVCVTCNQNIPSSQKPLRCSACKAVLYCSKAVCHELGVRRERYGSYLDLCFSAPYVIGTSLRFLMRLHIKCSVQIIRFFLFQLRLQYNILTK